MKLTEPRSWMRRIVPSGYTTALFSLTGTAPLLMSSGEADQESELYRAYKLLGQQKKKTLDDESRLREMEWKIRMYLDDEIGPYIPGKNIKELLRSAATKWKRGADVERSLVVIPYRVPLKYDGPRDEKGLWDGKYRYLAMVSNNSGGRVTRCRPKFDSWSIDAEIAFDPEDIDFDFLQLAADRTRKYGLGDYRPTFGTFDCTLTLIEHNKEGAKGSAAKHRNKHEERANETFVNRIKETA